MSRWIPYVIMASLASGCLMQSETVQVPAVTSEDAAVVDSGVPAAAASAGDLATEPAATSATEITLKILTFDQIQELIRSHRGKVVVMDCWSTSCDPCVKEFPNLVALQRKYGPEKVACISFSFDYEGLDKPEAVQPKVLKFLQQQQAAFDNVMSSEDSDTLYRKLELASIPAVYVYSQDGTVKRFDNEQIKKPEDAFTYKEVEAHVAKLLKGQE